MKKKVIFSITLLIIIIDQITKIYVYKLIPEGSKVKLFGNIIKLTHVTNTGGAYSLRTK